MRRPHKPDARALYFAQLGKMTRAASRGAADTSPANPLPGVTRPRVAQRESLLSLPSASCPGPLTSAAGPLPGVGSSRGVDGSGDYDEHGALPRSDQQENDRE
jgi:hypothetical protein